MLAPAGPAFGPIDAHEGHQARLKKEGIAFFPDHILPRRGNASLVFGEQRPKRTTDDTTPTTTRKKIRLARNRANWPAGAVTGRWAWRDRGARRGSRRVRVVCRAERRRDKFKRQRRSGVMVCVSAFVGQIQ